MIPERIFWGLLALLTLLAAALGLVSTHYGPGVGGDATIYLASARGLLDGIGLGYIDADGSFRLLPYFAPLFPLILAFIGLFGLDLVNAAQGLNIALFGGLVWLAGSSFYRLTKRAGLALGLAALLALSPILLPVFSWAMSEPLSLVLGFGGLWLAFRTLDEPTPGKFFWFSALCVGLSFLTRYASIAFVAAGALGLLALRPGLRLVRRMGQMLLYSVTAALPMLVWVLIGLAQTATVGSRSLESTAGMSARFAGFWRLLADAVLAWLLPFSWVETPPYPDLLNRLLLPAVGVGLVIWLVALFTRRTPAGGQNDAHSQYSRRDTAHWMLLLAIFALLYLLVIVAVYVTTYPPITIENRMLSPLYVAAVWLLVSLAALSLIRWNGARWLPPVVLAGLLLFAGWNGWRTGRIAKQNAQTGLGYNSLAWRNSETVAAVRDYPAADPLVTNEVTALMYLTGRTAYPLAEIYRDAPLDKFTRYGNGAQPDEAEQLFQAGDARLVLFDTLDVQLESIYGERTEERIFTLTDTLVELFTFEDGAIYVYPAQ